MGVPKSLDYKDFMSKSTSANPTTWDDMYRFFGNQGEITAALVKSLLYQPGTAYSIGAIVYSPNLPAGTIAKCTNAGTTGSTEPVWPAVGSAVNDGTVRWLVENSGGSNITVDATLDSTSSNAIANKAVYAALNNKLDKNGTAMYASRDSSGNIIKDTYATKSEVGGVVKSVNNIAPDSNGNVTITVSGGGGGGSGDYLPLTGGTVTGGITATNFQTGTGAANYFQCRKFRGEGNANSYYHAIDFGYSGHDSVDFYEYDPNWNFYKCLTGTKSGAVLVGNINGNGWNGGARLTGEPTAPTAPVGTNTTQIATTAFVQAAIPTNVSSFTNDAGYIKSVNNIKPDSNGNVTIAISGGSSITVDEELSGTSTNPIQNKAVTIQFAKMEKAIGGNLETLGSALNQKADKASLATVATSGSYTDLSNRPTVVKSVNNVTPDENGNVTITVSGGSGSGVSTSTQNTWTAKQNFQHLKFNFENFATSRISGTYDAPSTSVAAYNVTGALTLDMSTLAGMIGNGDTSIFTAYIASNGSYALSITNAGTLKYAGRASDLAITASGLLLNIFLTKNTSGVVTSIAQATKLS